MLSLRRPVLFAAIRWFALGSFACLCGLATAQGPADGAISLEAPAGVHATATNLETGERFSCETRRAGICYLLHLPLGEYRVQIAGGETRSLTVLPDTITELASRSAPPAADASTAEPDQDDDGLSTLHGLATNQTSHSHNDLPADQVFGGVLQGKGSDPALDPADDADSAERTTGPGNGLARGRRAGASYEFAQGTVREFHLGTGSYSAQQGNGANVLTSVSRVGGESLHGSGFFTLRSSVLAATNPLAVATSYSDGEITTGLVKPHDLRENFGANLGGAIPHLREVHFLTAVDLQRCGFPAISSPADQQFYDLTPIQRALLGTRGVPSSAIRGALNYLSSLTGSTPRRADQDIEFGRIDWHLGQRFAFGLEYNRLNWNSPAGLVDAPVVARARASLGNAYGNVEQLLLRVDPRWSSRTLTELRLAYTHDLQYETPQTPLAQEQAIGPNGTAPEVNIGPNGLLFGTPASLSKLAYPDEQRLEAGDVITLLRGRHLVQLGGNFGRAQEIAAALGNAAGTYQYNSGETNGYAGGLVDWITDYVFNVDTLPNGGCPRINATDHLFCFRSFTQSFGQTLNSFSTTSYAAFFEDTWRPVRRLSLHAGLRLDATSLPPPQHPNPALDAVFGSQGSTSSFPDLRNNLGPRFSAVLEPFGRGRGVLKLGYGAYFGRVPGATLLAALNETGEAPATTKIRIRPSAIVACPQQPANGFGYLCSFNGQPPAAILATTSALVFDRRFRLPLVQQASLSFERELGRRINLSLGYEMNDDRHLPATTDLNIAPSNGNHLYQLQGGTGAIGVRDGETFSLPFYAERISSSFGPVTDLISHVNATYHAGIVRASLRPLPGLVISGSYTRSKAMDYGQAISSTPRTNSQLDPFTNGYDKGLSSLNYPQAVHATATWSSRVEGTGLRRLADTWTVTAISTARSGRPYTCDLSGGNYLAGGHESLNGSGGALYLPTVGRNTLRLPATATTDVRVAKGLALHHAARLEASLEAFNVFNHQTITSVNQTAYLVGTPVAGVTPLVFQNAANIATEGLNTTPFGTPTGSGSNLNRERQVQMSLRLSF